MEKHVKWWNQLNVIDKTLLWKKYYEDGNFWQNLSSEGYQINI